jgi:hypothetical protein
VFTAIRVAISLAGFRGRTGCGTVQKQSFDYWQMNYAIAETNAPSAVVVRPPSGVTALT